MEKNRPEGAELSDILIFPILRRSEFFDEDFVTNYGYLSSSQPCDKCKEEINSTKFRPVGWDHECHRCKNYITFTDIAGYVNSVAKKSRSLKDIREHLAVYLAYKGREGLNNGKAKLIKSAGDISEDD